MESNYRLIEVAKDIVVSRANSDTIEYTSVDKIGKVEITPNEQVYNEGYSDYHIGL